MLINVCVCVCVCVYVHAQLHLILCDPIAYSLPDSSVHRIFSLSLSLSLYIYIYIYKRIMYVRLCVGVHTIQSTHLYCFPGVDLFIMQSF